jgi:hypothetical protein
VQVAVAEALVAVRDARGEDLAEGGGHVVLSRGGQAVERTVWPVQPLAGLQVGSVARCLGLAVS